MSARRFLPRVAVALLLVAAATAAWFNRDQINLAAFDAWLGSVGLWAPIAYVILYAVGTVAFVPGMIFALAGGALFGPFWGSIWNLAGATLGATFAFVVARYIAGDWIARKAGGLLKRALDGIDAEGWRFVAFVRLVPLFPFNLSNYVLGLTRIPLHQYVLATLVCMAPGAVAYTWLGYAGRGALAGEPNAIRYGLLALGLLADACAVRFHGSRLLISNAISTVATPSRSSTCGDRTSLSARLATLRTHAIFRSASCLDVCPSLPNLNKSRSFSSVAPTNAPLRQVKGCARLDLLTSAFCAAGWSNGTKQGCRSKVAPAPDICVNAQARSLP